MRSASVSASTPALAVGVGAHHRRVRDRATARRCSAGSRVRAVICSITARSVRHTPSRLTASVRSTCSIGAVASAPVNAMPALAIATSIAPKRSTVPATARCSASKSVTSASNAAARSPRRAASSSQALGLEADERDVRALGVQPLGGRRADAARGAGDEHGAAADVERGRCTAHAAHAVECGSLARRAARDRGSAGARDGGVGRSVVVARVVEVASRARRGSGQVSRARSSSCVRARPGTS